MPAIGRQDLIRRPKVKLLYPTSNFAYISTLIPMHCLHMVMNVDGEIFSLVRNSITAHCLNRMSSQPSCTELELRITVGSKLHMVEGRYHVTAWNQFYLVFITVVKI